MQLKINPILLGGILLGILIVVFALFKGCQNNKSLETKLNTSNVAFDSIKLRREADSMASIEKEQHYKDSLEYANGVIVLRENQRDATETRLLATTFALSDLQKKYAHIRPDTDTSVTLVDNEFVYDAKSCFESLEFQKKLVSLYIQEVKDVDSAHRSKEKLQENRIKRLGQERDGALLNYNDCMSVANQKLKALQPRRKILLSLSTIAIDRYYPSGVGAGLIYQDKHNRLFGLKGYGTNIGPVYTAEIALPLSLKRR